MGPLYYRLAFFASFSQKDSLPKDLLELSLIIEY